MNTEYNQEHLFMKLNWLTRIAALVPGKLQALLFYALFTSAIKTWAFKCYAAILQVTLAYALLYVCYLNVQQTALTSNYLSIPYGLVAQWIDHCTGIARSWVRISFKPKFFRLLFSTA